MPDRVAGSYWLQAPTLTTVRVRSFTRRRGISLAELCRQALRNALEAEASAEASTAGKPWMKYSGAIAGQAHESDNQNIDAIVHGAAR